MVQVDRAANRILLYVEVRRPVGVVHHALDGIITYGKGQGPATIHSQELSADERESN